jgi:3-oxoacyl-[acyl-carrier protein] reductase
MLAQGHGNIINVSSIIALRGFSGLVGYAATKAGLVGMTRALARELGGRNIRVNAIAPGYLETEMSESLSDEGKAQIIRRTPLQRLGTVADVVPWVQFLLSSRSGFVTGQVITIDGGASI